MLGKTLATFVVAAFIAAVPTAATAAPAALTNVAAADDQDSYAPHLASEPSLDGSLVASECLGDVPWISYSVALHDPDGVVTGRDAALVLSGSGNTTTIPLGTLGADNTLAGKVLWPGASVDSSGNATGWPGWAFEGGEWVETEGDFAWTRGPITAVIELNPDLSVPLSYPPATAACASPPLPAGTVAALAVTGSTFDPAPLLYAATGLIVIGGVAVVLVRRKTVHRR